MLFDAVICQAILQELDQLQTQKRKEALERIKTARKFCDFGEDSEYEAAMKAQADPLNGTISNDSPLAKNLLERSVGDEINLRTPGGEIKLKIVTIG